MLGKRCYSHLTLNKLPSGWLKLLLQTQTKLPPAPGRKVVVVLQEATCRGNPQPDLSPLEHTGRGVIVRDRTGMWEGVCRGSQTPGIASDWEPVPIPAPRG